MSAAQAVPVSVALASYQGAAHLPAQLRSILEQTRRPDEVVVGDDGSRDGSLELVRAELATAPEVHLVELPVGDGTGHPLGVAANFARILQATSHPVVLLSDQDDIWRRDRVAVSLDAFAQQPDRELLFSDARLVDAQGEPTGATLFGTLPVPESALRAVEGGDAFAELLRRNLVTGATTAVRRSLIDRALPIPPDWLHDEWLAIVAALGGALGVVREPLIDYRQHGGNVVGVRAGSLRHRMNRVLEPRGDRNRGLARRADELLTRADELGAPEERIALVRQKAAFEAARAAMPDSRIARWPQIARLARSGAYGRLASQGRLDVLRDALQPA